MSRSIFEGRGVGPRGALCELLLGLAIAWLVSAAGVQAGEPVPLEPLDLNRASAAELEALPGVGAVKAAAIVAERESSGGFQSIDELESVRGIGPALVSKLRPLVTVGSVGKPGGKKTMKSSTGSGKPTSDAPASERKGR